MARATQETDGMGNPVTLRYPGRPDSSMVEHLVQFQKGLGLSPGLVTFHAALETRPFSRSKRALSHLCCKVMLQCHKAELFTVVGFGIADVVISHLVCLILCDILCDISLPQYHHLRTEPQF